MVTLFNKYKIPKIVRSRTNLWGDLVALKDGAYSLYLSSDTYPELFDMKYLEITAMSSTGWKVRKSQKYLWFPKDSITSSEVTLVKEWVERFKKYVLIGINGHLQGSRYSINENKERGFPSTRE